MTLSLYLTKHNTAKTYRGVDVQIQVFLASALVEGEWSAHVAGSHWVGPRAALDDMEK
jgi:hypothetical protein